MQEKIVCMGKTCVPQLTAHTKIMINSFFIDSLCQFFSGYRHNFVEMAHKSVLFKSLRRNRRIH